MKEWLIYLIGIFVGIVITTAFFLRINYKIQELKEVGKGIMTQKACLIVKGIMKIGEKFLEESKEKYIQCPYCLKYMENPNSRR